MSTLTRGEELGARVHAVRERLEEEGLNPEDYHNLGIARDLVREVDWADALVMNKWINNNNNETKEV